MLSCRPTRTRCRVGEALRAYCVRSPAPAYRYRCWRRESRLRRIYRARRGRPHAKCGNRIHRHCGSCNLQTFATRRFSHRTSWSISSADRTTLPCPRKRVASFCKKSMFDQLLETCKMRITRPEKVGDRKVFKRMRLPRSKLSGNLPTGG